MHANVIAPNESVKEATVQDKPILGESETLGDWRTGMLSVALNSISQRASDIDGLLSPHS